MAVIQTRVFFRTVTSASELDTAIDQVKTEVNTFLASLPNLGDALNIQTNLSQIDKYGDKFCYIVTIAYVET